MQCNTISVLYISAINYKFNIRSLHKLLCNNVNNFMNICSKALSLIGILSHLSVVSHLIRDVLICDSCKKWFKTANSLIKDI